MGLKMVSDFKGKTYFKGGTNCNSLTQQFTFSLHFTLLNTSGWKK